MRTIRAFALGLLIITVAFNLTADVVAQQNRCFGSGPAPPARLQQKQPEQQKQQLLQQEKQQQQRQSPEDARLGVDDGMSTLTSTVTGVPASVCSGGAPFVQVGDSPTTCRLFVNRADGYFMCTAWFVTPNHVVTAGHCIAERRRYLVVADDPGHLCCGFEPDGSCQLARTWKLQRWVTTEGWWTRASVHNDGAVLRVTPLDRRLSSAGLTPQLINSLWPLQLPDKTEVYTDGFPGRTRNDEGCLVGIDPTKRYETRALVTPLNSHGGAEGLALALPLPGCTGQSGARVLLGGPTGAAFGIQTYGAVNCTGGARRGLTGVTQIVPSAAIPCGVCVASLLAALS